MEFRRGTLRTRRKRRRGAVTMLTTVRHWLFLGWVVAPICSVACVLTAQLLYGRNDELAFLMFCGAGLFGALMPASLVGAWRVYSLQWRERVRLGVRVARRKHFQRP